MTTVSAEQSDAEEGTVAPSSHAGLRSEPADQESLAQRHMMIAETAFFIAEARGFAANQELSDWLTAEREIDQRLQYANR